eukprot:Opistho-2@34934
MDTSSAHFFAPTWLSVGSAAPPGTARPLESTTDGGRADAHTNGGTHGTDVHRQGRSQSLDPGRREQRQHGADSELDRDFPTLGPGKGAKSGATGASMPVWGKSDGDIKTKLAVPPPSAAGSGGMMTLGRTSTGATLEPNSAAEAEKQRAQLKMLQQLVPSQPVNPAKNRFVKPKLTTAKPVSPLSQAIKGSAAPKKALPPNETAAPRGRSMSDGRPLASQQGVSRPMPAGVVLGTKTGNKRQFFEMLKGKDSATSGESGVHSSPPLSPEQESYDMHHDNHRPSSRDAAGVLSDGEAVSQNHILPASSAPLAIPGSFGPRNADHSDPSTGWNGGNVHSGVGGVGGNGPISSSLEDEKRFLRRLGWEEAEDDRGDDDDATCWITEEEMNQFRIQATDINSKKTTLRASLTQKLAPRVGVSLPVAAEEVVPDSLSSSESSDEDS